LFLNSKLYLYTQEEASRPDQIIWDLCIENNEKKRPLKKEWSYDCFWFDKDFRVQFWYTHAVEPFEEIYGVLIVGLNQDIL